VTLVETSGVAFQSIRANKLRALLTMLGIIIGVACVITMVALGTGAQRAVEDRINSLGARLISVFGEQNYQRGVASEQRVDLTSSDAEALMRDATLLSDVVPEIAQSLQVKYGNQNIRVSVVGTTPTYASVNNYEVRHGRVFTRGDGDARKRYAVLGHAVPGLLGANAAALVRQTLFIRGIPFEIIGVLDEKGASGSWTDPDEQILIPLETAQYRVFGSDKLRSITVRVSDEVPIEQGMVDLERVLRREHRLLPGADNDFRIRNRQEILETQQRMSEIFTYLLASIAGVSLLVGGIGIMNIMLVSVTERTREIGIRKALGARRSDLTMQFLSEAVVLSLFGGFVGVVAGIAVALLIRAATPLPASIQPWSIAYSRP